MWWWTAGRYSASSPWTCGRCVQFAGTVSLTGPIETPVEVEVRGRSASAYAHVYLAGPQQRDDEHVEFGRTEVLDEAERDPLREHLDRPAQQDEPVELSEAYRDVARPELCWEQHDCCGDHDRDVDGAAVAGVGADEIVQCLPQPNGEAQVLLVGGDGRVLDRLGDQGHLHPVLLRGGRQGRARALSEEIDEHGDLNTRDPYESLFVNVGLKTRAAQGFASVFVFTKSDRSMTTATMMKTT